MEDARSQDGRRRRSEASRDKIVDAIIDLITAGQLDPSAEQVAARAGVGLRSVFRHFKDMESLYTAMTARLALQYRHWLDPFEAPDWRGRVNEMLVRRTTTYDQMMQFKRAADLRRHDSATIQSEHEARLAIMRARLKSLLPDEVIADVTTFETLDLLLSFEAWLRLRIDQHLPAEQARAILATQVDRLLA